MTKKEAIEIVENQHGAMYWKTEPGRILAYPFETENPVIIETENRSTVEVKKPKVRVDYIKICETFGINSDREYFNIYSIGDALWKAYKTGVNILVS